MTLRRGQRGVVAMVLLLSILALGASYYMVSQLESLSMQAKAAERAHNARVLVRAKQALIGYVAAQASKAYEDNPGALPCPEAAAYYDDASNEGKTASSCTLPKVGRLPWRTLGLEKLVDHSGEPLWYVVSPGWARTSGNTTINSNSVGQLSLDSTSGTDADTIVALIIAPGPAISVTAASGCTTWTQTRPTTGTPDWRNYLECENATSPPDNNFVSTGPGISFNDQVIKITKADIMPGIEAAIANRIEREIAPALKAVYVAPSWGLSGTGVLFPFPAPFADPSTSAMQGSSALPYGGLLPFNYSETSPGSGTACTPGASAPRCRPTFVAWSSATLSGSVYTPTCTASATQATCTFYYWCALGGCASSSLAFTLTGTAANVGMALRRLNASAAMTNVDAAGRTTSGVLNADGSATVTLSGNTTVAGTGSFYPASLCSIPAFWTFFYGCKQSTLTVPITLLADHTLLDSTDALRGWFVRNKWHELVYYAVGTGYAPAVMPTQPSCTSGCLSVTNIAGAPHAIMILAGRTINNGTRPSATLADYLEFGNATGVYERQTVSSVVAASLKRPFNDRIVVVDTN